MKYIKPKSVSFSRAFPERGRWSGFSLIELLVAMSLFLIVGGAVVSLIRRHMPLFNTAQNQAGINISLRNAVAELQMEAVNAGSGYSPINPMPASPVGATIASATDATCKAKGTYIAACYDTLTLITADGSIPALAPSADAPGATATPPAVAVDTNTGGVLYLSFPGDPTKGAGLYNGWAGKFTDGDEILLLKGGTDFVNGKPSMAVLIVTGVKAAGNSLQLSYTKTGTLLNCPVTTSSGVVLTTMNGIPATKDPLGIYDPGAAAIPPECERFSNSFSPGLDYAIRLTSTTYSVDTATDPTNPKLVRKVTGQVTADVIAEQIIGFTVGAWSSKTAGYTNVSTDYSRDWASIRSLQIQLVARTTPSTDNSTPFKNSYDQGKYQVQGVSVVINPRNLNTN